MVNEDDGNGLRDMGNATMPRMHRSVRCTRTPEPRSKDSIHPSRISHVRNVVTPMESGERYVGKPKVTMAELSSGRKMAQEANAGNRKVRGIHNPPDRAIPNPKGC